MSSSLFSRHTIAVAFSFAAALGLAVLWYAAPAYACQQAHCFTYQQYMRPGFDPKKERPAAGPGKWDAPKARAKRDCLAERNRYYNFGNLETKRRCD
jgi:hypothetical protein